MIDVITKKTKKNILIIDDDAGMRLLIGMMLKGQFNVTMKKNGFDGMISLESGIKPDLILLDLDMPAVNGFDFLSALKKSGVYKNIPVIIISGFDQFNKLSKFNDLGAHAYLNKPFNPAELFQKIEEVLQH